MQKIKKRFNVLQKVSVSYFFNSGLIESFDFVRELSRGFSKLSEVLGRSVIFIDFVDLVKEGSCLGSLISKAVIFFVIKSGSFFVVFSTFGDLRFGVAVSAGKKN